MVTNPKIGIRPIIDGRMPGVREHIEEQVMGMARSAASLISESLRYMDGTPVQCVIADQSIGGGEEAARCAAKFAKEDVGVTLSVTPCWCYGSETMDLDPSTVKGVWGFNATERPGAVYLAAVMAAHAQMGLPAFAIYGRDVQDRTDTTIPEDVKERLLRFVRAAVAVKTMKNRAYVGIGSVSMGIMGSYVNADFFQKYLGMRTEWVDMSEVSRRLQMDIFDQNEYEKAREWVKKNCPEGLDPNEQPQSREQKDSQWDTCVKMALIFRDILHGNPALEKLGWPMEALGRNGIAGGFQGQRMWTDFMPNGDFAEAILAGSFDWNGVREPIPFATENDSLNGASMLFLQLLTGQAAVFSDVRTYWSPDAVKRITGWTPEGGAKDGFIHLINSGAAALDGSGAMKNAAGDSGMKPWWEVTEQDAAASLKATKWCAANRGYFRGGGFSSKFETQGTMPVTMIRINLISGLGPTLQIAEGYTVPLPREVNDTLLNRTDPTWPSTWFAPRLTGEGAFTDVYSVMANWGANHGAFTGGHVGADLITLASMLRIPVSLHNVSPEQVYRPHVWSAFGTQNPESADYRACETFGPMYK